MRTTLIISALEHYTIDSVNKFTDCTHAEVIVMKLDGK